MSLDHSIEGEFQENKDKNQLEEFLDETEEALQTTHRTFTALY